MMTPPQHPPTQASPDPKEKTTLLPPAPQPRVSAAGPHSGRRGLDYAVAILVLALAFLSASFVARNSDLWFHRATGRLLAQGQFTFGTDPFAYTTERVYWVCHSWLFDLALYGILDRIGGAGLVILKALLVTALAGLMLSVRRPGGDAWLSAVCTTLAVLAMSPLLLPRPVCVSYFLLGLTFWLLWRPYVQEANGRRQPSFRAYLPLLLVFVLWVNVDEWFVLGPLLAALFWLGGRLGGQRRTPGWLVPAGLAACLLSPHTYHAFTPPAELSPVTWAGGLRQDPRFHQVFASPWQKEYLHAAEKLNAAVLAYFALTALGLISFALYRPALRGWRLLVWLPFAVLAAFYARAIPFFVIVAAPITALNGQDYLTGRADKQTDRTALSSLLASLSLCLVLPALALLTWLGWLSGYDREDRHVGWGVQAEPSLQRVSETLALWRGRGLLPADKRVFAVSPEAAQYGTWFCPGEKQFLDHRYPLYPEAARDYETVCQALLPELVPPPSRESDSSSTSRPRTKQRTKDWHAVLRERGVGVVVYYDRDEQRLFGVLRRLAGDPEHWTLLGVAGQALIVGWNEAGSFAPLAFDADRLAFGPPDDQARQQAPAAPEQGPERLPPRRDFWARLAHPPSQPTWESPAAAMYLRDFYDSDESQQRRQTLAAVRSYAASLAGLPALPSGVPQAAAQLLLSHEALESLFSPRFLAREELGPFFGHLVERSPALPLLAVRAARRAVAADPEDARAWLSLGQAYLLLRSLTCERSSEGMLPPLAQLRDVQIAVALEQAVRLDPDLELAHQELAFLYGGRKYFDQSLEHRREEIRLSRRAGPRGGEKAEEWAYRLEQLDKDTAKMVELVEDRRKKYASGSRASQGDRVAEAKLALGLGLARQALDEVLLPTPADVLGPAGIRLQLDLLLALGRASEVRTTLDNRVLRASKHGLGYSEVPPPARQGGGSLYALPYRWPAYEWLHVLEAASVGDYVQARDDLRVLRAGLRAEHDQRRRLAADVERHVWPLVPNLLSGPLPFLPAYTVLEFGTVAQNKIILEAHERALRAQQADLCVLEGMLALEQGDPEAARSAFAEARELCAGSAGDAVPFAGRPIVTAYLGRLGAKD